jgi:hypothetical protein
LVGRQCNLSLLAWPFGREFPASQAAAVLFQACVWSTVDLPVDQIFINNGISMICAQSVLCAQLPQLCKVLKHEDVVLQKLDHQSHTYKIIHDLHGPIKPSEPQLLFAARVLWNSTS